LTGLQSVPAAWSRQGCQPAIHQNMFALPRGVDAPETIDRAAYVQGVAIRDDLPDSGRRNYRRSKEQEELDHNCAFRCSLCSIASPPGVSTNP
jgi:hypothetical protein